jgi:hypothetical protein
VSNFRMGRKSAVIKPPAVIPIFGTFAVREGVGSININGADIPPSAVIRKLPAETAVELKNIPEITVKIHFFLKLFILSP